MSQSSSTFSVFLPVDLHQPRQDQSTEVQVGKKKVLNVKIRFPKNPSLATTLPRGCRGCILGRGEKEVCGRLKEGKVQLHRQWRELLVLGPLPLPPPHGQRLWEAHGCPLALKR